MQVAWYEAIGLVGFALVAGAFLGLQVRRLSADSALFSLMNAAGALCIMISLAFDFNLAAFSLEFFWFLISLIGVWRGVRSSAG